MKLGLMHFRDIPHGMPYIEKNDDPKEPQHIYKKGFGPEDPRKDVGVFSDEGPVEVIYLYTRSRTLWMKIPIRRKKHVDDGGQKEFLLISDEVLKEFKRGRKKYNGKAS